MEQPTKRKLAAILMADVVGFSRLKQQDEAGAVAAMEACRQISFDQIIQQHGRVTIRNLGPAYRP